MKNNEARTLARILLATATMYGQEDPRAAVEYAMAPYVHRKTTRNNFLEVLRRVIEYSQPNRTMDVAAEN